MSTLIGPEQLASSAAIAGGQFFWQAPNVFLSPAGSRFSLQMKATGASWQIKAFKRDNVAQTWAEVDTGNGPKVAKPGVAFGHAVVAVGGYTAGSGVLDVDSTVGNPAFQGSIPFQVAVEPSAGVINAQLQVDGINSPTQFAVSVVGVDNNSPAGSGVFQTTATPSNPLQTPNGCPTFIQDPRDANKVICAFPEDTLAMLSFCVFDMSANGGLGAFGATTTGGPVVHGLDLVSSGRTYNDDTGAKAAVAYRASDNSLLFNYQGAPETVTAVDWVRPYLVAYDLTALSWGASVQLTGAGESLPFAAHGIVVDPTTNNAFATVVRPPNGLAFPNESPYELYCVPIEPDNTLHTRAAMTTAVRQIAEPFVSYPVLRPVGATFELLAWYIGGLLGVEIPNASVARGMVALAPVFTVESLGTVQENAPGDGSALASVGGAIGPDGNPYAFWFADLSATDFFYRLFFSQGTSAGAGWSAPAELYRTPSDDSVDFLEKGATVSPLPLVGLAIVGQDTFITPTSPGVDGAAYFEFDIPVAPSAPPYLTLTFKGYKVYAK